MSTDLEAEILPPQFPPEIEYEIFVLAFSSEKKALTKLLCVAKRVRDWLVPLIYDLIVVNSAFNPEQMFPKLEQYGHYVHQVVFMCPLEDIQDAQIFKLCPNIWNLAIWGEHVITASTYTLSGLKRLALNNLEGSGLSKVVEDVTRLRLHSAWFSNITHLIVSYLRTGESSKVHLLFPNLTHFLTVSATQVEVLREILHSYPKLEVVIRLLMDVTDENKILVVDFNSDKALKIDDARVVTMDGRLWRSWVKAAEGEVELDMWKVAERAIEARKSRSSVQF